MKTEVCGSYQSAMQVFVDLLNAKKIEVDVTALDTVEGLKEKISQVTGLSVSNQILHVSQNGSKVEIKNGSRIYLGDLIQSKTIISLSCKQNYSNTLFYINVVTETGQVLNIFPEGGNSARVDDLRKYLSTSLSLPEESLFLRIVDLSRYVNKGLVPLFNTLEEFCVSSGAVVYVQIHPWNHKWFHGKITRESAEKVMSSASDGQFLVKESVNYPGDYVLFLCADGKIRHYRVFCKKNMMFTINEKQFFDTIEEVVKFHQSSKGILPFKLTEPVGRLESSKCTSGSSSCSGEGSCTNSSLPRDRLQTVASSEIQLQVVVESKTFPILTTAIDKVRSLKEQIAELSGVPVDCQLLRHNGKPLVMDTFDLGDYRISDSSTIHVQVHPWSEEWYVGKMSADEVENEVKGSSVADGMFLIRERMACPGDYCLLLWWKGKSVTYKVYNKSGSFAIEKNQQFVSLSSLVEYYKSNRGSLKTRLTEPVKINKERRGLIPPAVLARGSKAKAAYNRALKRGKTCDTRVRIMLIGPDGAGKTSLKRSLKGETFNNHEPGTRGLEVDSPVLDPGIKAWKAHQADETTTAFDHRSAQLVARQLSVESPTQLSTPGLPDVHQARKSPSSSTVKYNGDCEANTFFSGVDNCGDLPSSHCNGADGQVEPPSPPLQDDVFISDSEPSHELPQTIMNLVERILLQEHPAVNEEVWPVIWDFSGQALFDAIHPVFMSQEAVYLLVCDLSKDLFKKEDTCVSKPGLPGQPNEGAPRICSAASSLDRLMSWMDLVHSLQDPSTMNLLGSAQPPVILVGTHADKVVGDPWTGLNAILDSFHGQAFSSHIVDDKFAVENTRSGKPFPQEDPNIQRLRQTIISVASTLPHIKREIPLQWLHVEKELRRMAHNGFKHLTKAHFKSIAETICHFEVEEDSEELLHFLCDCGAVLCFNETSCSGGLIVLDPQWLIRVFCQIITVVPSKKEPMRIREHRQNLAKEGVLAEELVSFACQTLGIDIPKECLLSIMEKSNLVCRWDARNGQPIYLVPSMLKAKPEEEISSLIDGGSIAPVYLTFNTGYVPYGLFARFLVLFDQWASHEQFASSGRPSANAARFFVRKENNFTLMFACLKRVLVVHLVHEGKEEAQETATICQQLCSCIDDILDRLRQQCPWLHSMTWQLCARCDLCVGEVDGPGGCLLHHVPSCPHPDCAHFIPLTRDPLRCDTSLRSTTRLDEDKLKPWVKNFRRRIHYPDLLPYKPGKVSHDDLLNLAGDLGLHWSALCRILLGESQRVHIDSDQKALFDKCYVTLNTWTQAQGSQATYAALGVALMHEDLQAEHLCEKFCLTSQDLLESSI